VQLRRLAEAHEQIIISARDAAEQVDKAGDAGSNDVFVSNVLRTNELQVWFLTEHLVAASPVTA
jgi:starvation-inducible DNA-binding protein